jgi:hypothetical protein
MEPLFGKIALGKDAAQKHAQRLVEVVRAEIIETRVAAGCRN